MKRYIDVTAGRVKALSPVDVTARPAVEPEPAVELVDERPRKQAKRKPVDLTAKAEVETTEES